MSWYSNLSDFFNLRSISAQFDFTQLGITIVLFYNSMQSGVATILFCVFISNRPWLLYEVSWFSGAFSLKSSML